MIRYISDLHLYDPAITYWAPDVEHRTEVIVTQWNQTVSADDVTFILGDIGPPDPITFSTISKLVGKKILIRGNHDDVSTWTPEQKSVFDVIHDYILSNGVLLIHRPQDRVMFDSHIGTSIPKGAYFEPPQTIPQKVEWVIHGHLHTMNAEKVAGDYKQYLLDSNRYNCCADMIDFCPRTILELAYYKEQAINTERN